MTPKEHWRRDRHSFFNLLALDRAALTDPQPLHGLAGAVVSGDTRSGARTYCVEIPPGWKQSFDAREACLELFVLRGDVALDGDRVGASGYVHLPQAGGGGELRSKSGALALAFWNPSIPAFPPPYTKNRALRLWQEPWHPSLPDSHGIMHKSLRLPDPFGQGYDGGPGGYLRVLFIAPGIDAPFEHVHHECFEEIILLQGDVLLADEGVMGIGTVTIHPQEWWHGPFASRSGAVVMVHTDAPMGFPWPPRPNPMPLAKEICCAYFDEARWDVATEHTPWAETPWTRIQDDPEFQKWAKSKHAAEFGDEVGKDVASKFRAAWKFDRKE